MAGLHGLEVAHHRVAQQREVPDGVEDLVADELVLEAQGVVQDAGLPDDHRVLQAAPPGQARPPQRFHLAQEAEGAGGGDVGGEGLGGHAHGEGLMAQERVVEADRIADGEVVGG